MKNEEKIAGLSRTFTRHENTAYTWKQTKGI